MVFTIDSKLINLAIGTAHGKIRHVLVNRSNKLIYKCTWLPEHFLPAKYENNYAIFYSREYNIDELSLNEIIHYYNRPFESSSIKIDGDKVLVCMSQKKCIWYEYDRVQFELNAFIMKDILEERYRLAGVSFYLSDEQELRFNPYHDPENGRFISNPSSYSGICLIKAKEGSELEEYNGKFVRIEKGKIMEVVEDYQPGRDKMAAMTEQEIIEEYKKRNITHLSESDRLKVKEETGWPDEILDCIEDMDEYEVYKSAGLRYAMVNGRHCLLKDIDLDYVDSNGVSNRERMKQGNAPIDKDTGKPIQLHHMRQEHNAPFVELTSKEHKNKSIHKHNDDPSWRRNKVLEEMYSQQRETHYKERYQ